MEYLNGNTHTFTSKNLIFRPTEYIFKEYWHVLQIEYFFLAYTCIY